MLIMKSASHNLLIIVFSVDRESKEHDDTFKTDTTEEQGPSAKVSLFNKQDLINNKKKQAVHKEKKKQQEKLRSIGSVDYSTVPVDKHETEFVSCSESGNVIVKWKMRRMLLIVND